MAVAAAWLSRRLLDCVSDPCKGSFQPWIGCDRSRRLLGSLRYVAHKQYGWIRGSVFGRGSGEAWKARGKRSPRRSGDFRAPVDLAETLAEFASELKQDRLAVEFAVLQSKLRSFSDSATL